MTNFMACYKKRHEGEYGNPGQWRSAFRQRMSKEEAQEELKSDRPWDILHIPSGAPWAVIKKAYREACKKWHPDLHRVDGQYEKATEEMKKVNAAFTLLEYEYGEN